MPQGETFQIFNTTSRIVTSLIGGNALWEILLRNFIKCALIVGLDELHCKDFDLLHTR